MTIGVDTSFSTSNCLPCETNCDIKKIIDSSANVLYYF